MSRLHLSARTFERWNETAKDCYRIGCNCEHCYLKNSFAIKCQMKRVVIELVKRFGAPHGVHRQDILED